MDEFLKKIPVFIEDGLGIDIGQIGIQLLATLILFGFIWKFLWKPVTELLEQRQELVVNDLEGAKKANEDANAIKEQLESKLASARDEAKNILAASKVRAEVEKSDILKDANLEAVEKLNKAKADIELEIEKAKKDLKDEIVNVAFKVAEKIIDEEVDKDKHESVINQFISEVDQDAK